MTRLSRYTTDQHKLRAGLMGGKFDSLQNIYYVRGDDGRARYFCGETLNEIRFMDVMGREFLYEYIDRHPDEPRTGKFEDY